MACYPLSLWYYYYYINFYMHVHLCCSTCGEFRGQHAIAGSLIPPCRAWVLNSRYSGLVASTLTTEQSPPLFILEAVLLYNLDLLFIPASVAAWINQCVYYHQVLTKQHVQKLQQDPAL